MALRINQAGTYRNTLSLRVNQAGTYRTIVDGCINQTGTYRCFGFISPTGSLSVSPASYNEVGGSATLTWSSTRATCVVSTSNFSTSATSGSTTVSGGVTRTFSITFGNSVANSTPATATVTVIAPALGASFGGGFLICKASPLRWVVAPSSAQVSRTWYDRNDGATRAQQVSGVGGWFVPTMSQLQNPGYICRSFWDTCSCGSGTSYYWSSTEAGAGHACSKLFYNGGNHSRQKACANHVRAFRCVTY